MRFFQLYLLAVFSIIILGCSKSVNYSEAFKKETSGKYLFNQDDVIEVFYKNDELYLDWRGIEKKPVVLDSNEFFVADMYKKLRFTQHPKTKKRYLSIIHEDDENKITYDYLKVPNDFKTPSQHLKDKNYEQALEGFLKVKQKDSTSVFIEERDFNRLGYRHMRDKQYSDAIEVFKINVALHPNSANVYDSLAEAYLKNGDSLQAYNNYKKSLELYNNNERARTFVKSNKDKFEKI